MDTMTKEARSALMARIKSSRTRPELVLHATLKGNWIPHKMWPKMEGNPDVLLGGEKTVVFMHGCFWHGCFKHFRLPKTNARFWRAKIDRNKERHRQATRRLRAAGYKVLVVWEHELRRGYNVGVKFQSRRPR